MMTTSSMHGYRLRPCCLLRHHRPHIVILSEAKNLNANFNLVVDLAKRDSLFWRTNP